MRVERRLLQIRQRHPKLAPSCVAEGAEGPEWVERVELEGVKGAEEAEVGGPARALEAPGAGEIVRNSAQ